MAAAGWTRQEVGGAASAVLQGAFAPSAASRVMRPAVCALNEVLFRSHRSGPPTASWTDVAKRGGGPEHPHPQGKAVAAFGKQ